jgi:carbonic anhydrase/acetyltransferase-like protein (isoleucine patch superfamily)
MLVEHEGREPRISASAYVAPNAVISGDVSIGSGSRVLFGAVVTEDGGKIEIGDNCIIMEHALIRGRSGYPVRIGDRVLIGPFAHVNGAQIAEESFIATGASLFPGARIGRRAEVRVNGVVHVNSVLPPGAVVPIGWVAVGDPCEVLPPEQHERIWSIQRNLDFPGTVLGVGRSADGGVPMTDAMARYSELFGRHRSDRVLAGERR